MEIYIFGTDRPTDRLTDRQTKQVIEAPCRSLKILQNLLLYIKMFKDLCQMLLLFIFINLAIRPITLWCVLACVRAGKNLLSNSYLSPSYCILLLFSPTLVIITFWHSSPIRSILSPRYCPPPCISKISGPLYPPLPNFPDVILKFKENMFWYFLLDYLRV